MTTALEKTFKLTTDQKNALTEIKDFLNSDEKIFILKGYAGTGKTTLIKYIYRYAEYELERIPVLGAPTGRAARVLTQRTGIAAKTIHSLLYVKDTIEEEYKKERFKIIFKLVSGLMFDLFIFDEASMISDNQDDNDYLKFSANNFLKDILDVCLDMPDSKIIFIGDPAQLPPVKQDISPAIDEDYLLDHYFYRPRTYTLKEVVRQKQESYILQNATKIRDDINKNNYYNFGIILGDDVTLLPKEDAVEHFINQNENSLFITYKNVTAIDYNKKIRAAYGYKEMLVKGENIVITQNNQKYSVSNGDFFTITDIDDEEYFHVDLPGLSTPLQLVFRNAVIQGMGDEVECKLFVNSIFSMESALTYQDRLAVYLLSKEHLDVDFPDANLFKKDKKQFIEMKKKFIEALDESPYYNSVNFKYGYAATCHKAQGGEWENVFIDFSDFYYHKNINFYRWAYTAITRSRKKLFVINPPNYYYTKK